MGAAYRRIWHFCSYAESQLNPADLYITVNILKIINYIKSIYKYLKLIFVYDSNAV